jgi:sarcosine oxidase delta subunit
MDWKSRLPKGVNDLKDTPDGFTAGVTIPPDEDGYIGRRCPGCRGHFRMLSDEYLALPDETRLTCPYCGSREDEAGEFMTQAQRDRARAAGEAVAEQWIHEEFGNMLGRALGSQRSSSRGGMFSIRVEHTPSRPPRIRSLPEIVEDKVLRTITCPGCGTRYAVYGASAFCPVCGPRAAAETVLEGIEAARQALALEDLLPENQRAAARAAGVFDRLAADTVKNIVGLFEVFAGDQFTRRAPNPAAVLKGKRNIFQRLDDTSKLFGDHCGIDLPDVVGQATWNRLREDFARRHVLTHCDGMVDTKFLTVVTNCGLQVGQRLVIRRTDADRALDDVQSVVEKLAAAP